jgi:hypothetical protein
VLATADAAFVAEKLERFCDLPPCAASRKLLSHIKIKEMLFYCNNRLRKDSRNPGNSGWS